MEPELTQILNPLTAEAKRGVPCMILYRSPWERMVNAVPTCSPVDSEPPVYSYIFPACLYNRSDGISTNLSSPIYQLTPPHSTPSLRLCKTVGNCDSVFEVVLRHNLTYTSTLFQQHQCTLVELCRMTSAFHGYVLSL